MSLMIRLGKYSQRLVGVSMGCKQLSGRSLISLQHTVKAPMLLSGFTPVTLARWSSNNPSAFAKKGNSASKSINSAGLSASELNLKSFENTAKASAPSADANLQEPMHETATPQLTWDGFFKLRKRRRFYSFMASCLTAGIASIVAFEYFANLVIDFNQLFMGIEMQWIYLAGIVISGLLGWLAGPLLGNALFDVFIGSKKPLFHQMNNVFLRHVVKNRPNPQKHNVNTNPLPDYYGEKISSLRDYRQWLREGRLFAKKAEQFFD